MQKSSKPFAPHRNRITLSGCIFAIKGKKLATQTWRKLANTIQPFMCGGDAAFCKITLTTCFNYRNPLNGLFKVTVTMVA